MAVFTRMNLLNIKVLLNLNYLSEGVYRFSAMGELQYARWQHIQLPATETLTL